MGLDSFGGKTGADKKSADDPKAYIMFKKSDGVPYKMLQKLSEVPGRRQKVATMLFSAMYSGVTKGDWKTWDEFTQTLKKK